MRMTILHRYDNTMYTMAGLLAVATVAHGLVRPIKYPPSPTGTVIPVEAKQGTTEVVETKSEVGDSAEKSTFPKTDEVLVGDREVKK